MMRLLPLVLLVGCAPTAYRLGVKAAGEGQYYEASKIWLGALDEDIYQVRPRTALRDHAELAWNQRWELAQEYEASKRYRESIEIYDDMKQFAMNLEDVELLEFSTDQAMADREDTWETWTQWEWAQAVAKDGQGQWAESVAHFDQVRELNPGFPELDVKEGFTLRLWAEEDVDRHRYEDASAHYRRSFDLTGNPDTDAWGAAVDAAIGRYALSRGFCRSALEHFERAGDAVGDLNLEADRIAAADCSRVGVVIEPFAEEAKLDESTSLGSMLLDLMERRMETEGTRYVRILATEVLDGAENPPDRRVRVKGRVTQAAVDPPETTKTTHTVEAEQMVECDKETTLYEPDAICTEYVTLQYEVHRTAQSVRLAGSVKVLELDTGEQKTRPIDVTVVQEVKYATDFQVPDEEGDLVKVRVGEEVEEGKVIAPAEVLALDRRPASLPPQSEIVAQAVDVLATAAGQAVLDVVDKEDPLPDPRRLEIRKPTLLPEHLDFQSSVPPDPEPPGPPVMKVEPLPDPSPPVEPQPEAPPEDSSDKPEAPGPG